MKIRLAALVAAAALGLAGGGCVAVAPPLAGPRPATWALPVPAKLGLPNLNRVGPGLYRSAQPTREGFALLDLGVPLVAGDRPIRTVVSLRAFDSDLPLVPAGSGLRIERLAFKTWHPENVDVVRFLKIVTDPARQPVLVHCQHGSDRTGTMVAIYRIAVQGWTQAEAKEEMVRGGYGFHPMWNVLLRYIDGLDVEALRRVGSNQ